MPPAANIKTGQARASARACPFAHLLALFAHHSQRESAFRQQTLFTNPEPRVYNSHEPCASDVRLLNFDTDDKVAAAVVIPRRRQTPTRGRHVVTVVRSNLPPIRVPHLRDSFIVAKVGSDGLQSPHTGYPIFGAVLSRLRWGQRKSRKPPLIA